MAQTVYCWRCKADIPMLDEDEWMQVEPHLTGAGEQIKSYRRLQNSTLSEASRLGYGRMALDRYFRITGYQETNPHSLWHHRLGLLGPPCQNCGRRLRTPRAAFCAACGTTAAIGRGE